ncbi:E3 ubiquitin-protein ligase RNF180 [Conger conger]|uniref:E3 ubiquitin-protein ligase RNF180 n=1 Tax=Conger conger TaxID=82655 RepID=UPI002A5ADA36|nr:E3 ubiquitin-protein ligase RNF180 [Conger conger]
MKPKPARWTIGKLSCQYCGARAGGLDFHFVSTAVQKMYRTARHRSPPSEAYRDGAAAAADTPDEIARITDALCLEARAQLADIKASGEEARSSTLRWPPGTTVTSAGAHRKARSLDYKSGDVGTRGPRQSLSGSLSVLPQTHTPEWASLPVTHPCADCQRASSSYATRRASGLTLPTPPPLGSEPSPPGASPGERGVGPAPALRRRVLSHSSTEQGEEEEEREEEAQRAGVLQVSPGLATSLLTPAVERRLSKRERNRMKILRRRQRRRDRWIQSQLQEHRQSSTGNVTTSSSEDEDLPAGDRDGFICAVCLDVYFSPYMCHPCNHVFCEPCLRTLAKNSPANTPCPLCRTLITHVFFQKELNHTTRTFFPKEYLSRKQNFQRASCSKWPLPSCRKLFRIFGGFRRQASPITRRQFPHGGYRLDALDLEDDSRGWRFDMDMVIIYIYSVNWVIGFILFCFLCYLFFPSF